MINHIVFYILLFALSNVKGAAIYAPGTIYLSDKAIALDDGYQLTIQGVFGGMTLISTALLLWFRGFWDSTIIGQYTQRLTGFIVLGFVTWVMLINFEPAHTYGTNRLTIYYIVPFSVGLLATILMSKTIHLYLMMLGGLGGLSIGLWILGWKTDLVITSAWGRAILLTILAVVFMFLAPTHHTCHSFGAALTGAYLLFMGLDIFFHTGFLYVFTTTFDSNANHVNRFQTNRNVYIMQACLIVAVIAGQICQSIASWRIMEQHTKLLIAHDFNEAEQKHQNYWRRFPSMPFFGHHQVPGPVAAVQPAPAEPII